MVLQKTNRGIVNRVKWFARKGKRKQKLVCSFPFHTPSEKTMFSRGPLVNQAISQSKSGRRIRTDLRLVVYCEKSPKVFESKHIFSLYGISAHCPHSAVVLACHITAIIIV